MTPKSHIKYSATSKANTHQQVGLQASDMQGSSCSSQTKIFNWQNVCLLWTDCNTWPGVRFDSKLFKKDDNTTKLQKQNTAVPGEAFGNTIHDVKPQIFNIWTKDLKLLEAAASLLRLEHIPILYYGN